MAAVIDESIPAQYKELFGILKEDSKINGLNKKKNKNRKTERDFYEDTINNENDNTVPDTGDLYYESITRTKKLPYNRETYLAECKKKADHGSKNPLNFIVTKVETHYAPKVLTYLYEKNRPAYINNSYLTTVGVVNPKKKGSNNSSGNKSDQQQQQQQVKYKDVICVRGRTIPLNPGEKSKTVVAYVKYTLPNYGPRVYFEAREGFNDFSYIESNETLNVIDPSAQVSEMKSCDGVDRFVRWLQNYMFTKKNIKKNGRTYDTSNAMEEDGGGKFDFSESISTYNTINPDNFISYSYLFNVPGYKSLWGRIPEPEENGPDRHILEV